MLSSVPASQKAVEGALETDSRFLPGDSSRAETNDLPESPPEHSETPEQVNCTNHSPITPNAGSILAASPARPTSGAARKKQGRPQKIFTSRSDWYDATEAAIRSGARSYPSRRQAATVSNADSDGGDGQVQLRLFSGSRLVDQPIRKSSRKRFAPQEQSAPVTQQREGKAKHALKYDPRLVSASLSI